VSFKNKLLLAVGYAPSQRKTNITSMVCFYYFIFPDKRIIIDDHLHYYNNPVSIYFGIVICVTILILLYIYKRISTKIQNNRSAEIKSDIN
jgi:hypothetical protein